MQSRKLWLTKAPTVLSNGLVHRPHHVSHESVPAVIMRLCGNKPVAIVEWLRGAGVCKRKSARGDTPGFSIFNKLIGRAIAYKSSVICHPRGTRTLTSARHTRRAL